MKKAIKFRVMDNLQLSLSGKEAAVDPKPGAWCAFKIERMSCFDRRPVARKAVPDELRSLQATDASDGLHIFPDAQPASGGHWQFPRICASWGGEGQGYVVQCYETADSRSYFLATSAQLSTPEVYVELGGMTEELWPAQLFVPYDLARTALEHFLNTGLQDPALAWVGLNVFPRKTVPRRPRGLSSISVPK